MPERREAMTERNLLKKPYPLGAHREGGGIRFSFVSRTASCGIMLYDKETGAFLQKIPFAQNERIGNVYCKTVENLDADTVTYLFYEDEQLVVDEHARVFPARAIYGKARSREDLKAGFLKEDFDWGQDRFPRLSYDQMVVYCMHVRGFTRHASSKVEHRGTFAGIQEKIPYLKEIGITTLELQPAYEFMELPLEEEKEQGVPYFVVPGEQRKEDSARLNYWGYTKGYYYLPKASYAASCDPSGEFKALVQALHENQMELVMQFYFPEGFNRMEISEILRFWVLEYHVDGFHLMGQELSVDMLAADELFADTKLWYYHFDTDRIYGKREQPMYPHLAEYNDNWYYDMRRFLKGDGNMLGAAMYHMRHIPDKAGSIHYLTNYYGFTLADLVSYDHKHNEANGEDNRDGNDYNCSWNCGDEGIARSQKIRKLRLKQMKNAMCLLLLSQSTPLIFMGDEFGNSQKGNNNPYCQDNAVTWLDWNQRKKNAELVDFWKMLADFRRKHLILRPKKELRLMDYIGCGYPDLSYHGQNAWQPQTDPGFYHVGMMFCERYAKSYAKDENGFIYLALNMHWENHRLALPRLPKGLEWERAFSTEAEERARDEAPEEGLLRQVAPRSIAMYVAVRK